MHDGFGNMGIGAATAEISAHFPPDVVRFRCRIGAQQPLCRHDLPGRAIPALKRIMIHKGLLDRTELLAVHEAFEGQDLCSFRLHGEGDAGITGQPVHEHRTGPALASFTADFGSGKTEPFAENVKQGPSGLYDETMELEADAIKMMKDNGLVVHDPSPAALARWHESADRAVGGLLGTVFSKELYTQVMSCLLEYRKAHGQ